MKTYNHTLNQLENYSDTGEALDQITDFCH